MAASEETIKELEEFFVRHTKLIALLLERSRLDDRIIDGFAQLNQLYNKMYNGVCSDWDEQNREYEATLNLYRDITARYEALLREHGIEFDPVSLELLDEPDEPEDEDDWDYLDEDDVLLEDEPAAEAEAPAERASDRLGQFLLD